MKIVKDFKVVDNKKIADNFALITLSPVDNELLPVIQPGQFAQVKIDDSPSTFLRRPISICDYEKLKNTLRLLVRNAGEGTAHLIAKKVGDVVNLLLPLGNGYKLDLSAAGSPLLVGGGVGTAPLLLLAKELARKGVKPSFLIGARSENLLLMIDELNELGEVFITTDDGSAGEKGVVTQHSILSDKGRFDAIYCCGPAPMMKSVARFAKEANIKCEVSLENMMACGMGACLCCVENTVKGNVCVCTEGPVFNINKLTW